MESLRSWKGIDIGVDSVQRSASRTGLPPFVIIFALRLRGLGISSERSILWARSIFEKNPSEPILAAYEDVLCEFQEAIRNTRIRELCEKLNALDQETVENMEMNLASLGVTNEEPLQIQGVRINFVSRLLYQYYDWGDVSAGDVFLFTKILLRRFNRLLGRLAEVISGHEGDDIYLAGLDPDSDQVSIGEHTSSMLQDLEAEMRHQGRYQAWLRENEPTS